MHQPGIEQPAPDIPEGDGDNEFSRIMRERVAAYMSGKGPFDGTGLHITEITNPHLNDLRLEHNRTARALGDDPAPESVAAAACAPFAATERLHGQQFTDQHTTIISRYTGALAQTGPSRDAAFVSVAKLCNDSVDDAGRWSQRLDDDDPGIHFRFPDGLEH